MGWLDVIECGTLDARPSTLPDRAPRCMEDELLPRVQPVTQGGAQPHRSYAWPTQHHAQHTRAQAARIDRERRAARALAERERRRRQYEDAAARQAEHEVRAAEARGETVTWCSACTARRARADGLCGRRLCRERVE
jgi:hypothetical protein